MKKYIITITETDTQVELQTSFNPNELLELCENRSAGEDLALAALNGVLSIMERIDDDQDDEEESSIH